MWPADPVSREHQPLPDAAEVKDDDYTLENLALNEKSPRKVPPSSSNGTHLMADNLLEEVIVLLRDEATFEFAPVQSNEKTLQIEVSSALYQIVSRASMQIVYVTTFVSMQVQLNSLLPLDDGADQRFEPSPDTLEITYGDLGAFGRNGDSGFEADNAAVQPEKEATGDGGRLRLQSAQSSKVWEADLLPSVSGSIVLETKTLLKQPVDQSHPDLEEVDSDLKPKMACQLWSRGLDRSFKVSSCSYYQSWNKSNVRRENFRGKYPVSGHKESNSFNLRGTLEKMCPLDE